MHSRVCVRKRKTIDLNIGKRLTRQSGKVNAALARNMDFNAKSKYNAMSCKITIP